MSKSERDRIRREKAAKNKEHASHGESARAPKTYFSNIVTAIQAFIQKHICKRQEPETEKEWEHKWRKREVWGLWTAAGVGIVAVVVSSIDSHQQKASLDAQQRVMQTQLQVTLLQMAPNLVLTFVGPDQPKGGTNGKGWYTNPKLENRGGVTATEYWGYARNAPFKPPGMMRMSFPNTDPEDVRKIPKISIPPGASGFQRRLSFSDEDVRQAAAGTIMLILWGYYEYTSGLPEAKVTRVKWCYEAAPIDAGDHYTFAYAQLLSAHCNMGQ